MHGSFSVSLLDQTLLSAFHKTKDCLKYKSFEEGKAHLIPLIECVFLLFLPDMKGGSVRSAQQHSSSPVGLFHRLQQYYT